MKTIRLMMMPVLASAAVFAAETAVGVGAAPLKPTLQSLKCGAGQHAVSDGEGFFCLAGSSQMGERLNGPAISIHKNGVKSGEGRYVNGAREGLWVFFDDQGNKVKEIEFKSDNYNGRFVEYANGRKIREENWVNGVRQGPQLSFDASGVATITEFRDGKPVK
ncbi:MAG: toxin-antitoxin system YwqK family antitoxin [Myxococcota bacterium]